MNYQMFEPREELASLVKCYWILEGPAQDQPDRQTIIPDGCMEMIFHYGDLYKQYLGDGTSIIQPGCFVFGQITRTLEIEPTGATGIFSVRFHPYGFVPFATLPIKDMENRAVPLAELFGSDGMAIEQQILNASTTAERIERIEAFLLSRLANPNTIDQIIKSTIDTMLTANGQISINELSRLTNINRRQLERKFAAAIGLSPKQLSKTIRLQATLNMLLDKKFTSLTALAYAGEYYDQAHFIRDFKEFTGLTPKEFYGDSLKMTSLFIAD